jgi:hypothetical protein
VVQILFSRLRHGAFFWRVVQILFSRLRHGAFFGEWCKSFFQGCATEPFSGTKLTKIKCFYKLIGILVVY